MSVLGLIWGFGIIFILIAVVVSILCYVLFSYPLYQMAVKAGLENAWLAWIPVARMYTLCMLGKDDFELFGQWRFPQRSYGFWGYVILVIAGWILGKIPLIGGILAFACWVAKVIIVWRMSYDLIRTYGDSGADGMVLSIISAIIPLVLIVVLWMYRNNEPKMNEGASYEYMG